MIRTEVNEEINHDGIDSTVISLNNTIDSIVSTLNSIDMIIYNLDDYFKGSVADDLRNKYQTYRNKYDLIRSNLDTYTSDLVKVKNGVYDLMQDQIRILDSNSVDLNQQSKEIKIGN